MDDVAITGGHMTKSSSMMMGSKLQFEWLSKNHRGLNSQYRWTGSMMGIVMDFTVIVTRWTPGKEKVWETIGTTKLLIYSWYKMHLVLEPQKTATNVTLSITYERPKTFWSRLISILFADIYCAWCLRQMLRDAHRHVDKTGKTINVAI
jgi:hypothetical protein